MKDTGRARLKAALGKHYSAQRDEAGPEAINSLARAMVVEDARMRRSQPRSGGHVAFVAAQVRYIPAWTWAAQAAIVALMCAVACASTDAGAAKPCVGALSTITVLVGVPAVQASKLHGVAELEYSCPNNAASVMLARLIALGCSSALAVSLMVTATSSYLNVSAFDAALWACPPFFCSSAGSLMVLRKAAPSAAAILCMAWTATCSAALIALAGLLPGLYGQASLAVWAGAAALALAWLAREVAMTFKAVSEGLDSFSPHMARTHN
ncbi:hypothetical protein [Curtanaerobium respiraculi]|uniref:hypothetical protein n=1 Tax=Curtanaerobium respiraculi TaxID=2949669 RepID=UPI0024B3987B|nr:hypothetical protein [Curtanaerobium respiraculi]